MNRREFSRTLGLGALAIGTLAHRAGAAELLERKIVVIGDGGVGKSALTIRFAVGVFVEDYDPTIADSYRKQVKIGDQPVLLDLFDTVGQADRDKDRHASYPGAHLVLICFDLTNRSSFASIEPRWAPEIARHAPGVPFWLVGCKADLAGRTVTDDEAGTLAGRLGARGYRKCSAKSGVGVDQVFDTAIRATLG